MKNNLPTITCSFHANKKFFDNIKKLVRKQPSMRFEANPYIVGNEAFFHVSSDNSIEYNHFKEELTLLLDNNENETIDNSKSLSYNIINKLRSIKLRNIFGKE